MVSKSPAANSARARWARGVGSPLEGELFGVPVGGSITSGARVFCVFGGASRLQYQAAKTNIAQNAADIAYFMGDLFVATQFVRATDGVERHSRRSASPVCPSRPASLHPAHNVRGTAGA